MIDDTAFKPFVPPESMFEAGKDGGRMPNPPAADEPVPTKKRERRRSISKKRSPAAGGPKIPPAPKHERPTRKKKETAAKKAINKAFKKTRAAITETLYGDTKKRKAKQPRALKLDMASAMAISAMLKPADFKMFESLTETLQSVNKSTRRRVLAAIGKVFG